MENDAELSGEDMSNTATYIDFCSDWINYYENENGYTGFPGLFAEALQRNEDDFYPEYYSHDGDGAVIYEDRFPWEMTDRVKNMTADDMTAIFTKYLDELGIKANLGRQYIEFFG